MFLNLKNKKIAETIANQQARFTVNHPKTHREDSQERLSREQKEIKSYRQHHQNVGGKRQPPTNNNSFTNFNPHFKIKIPQFDREGTENLSRSQEKLDSFRMEKVTNAYRKIKKIDNNDHSYFIEDLERSHEKVRKTAGKPKTGPKKELHANITKNHVCATEAAEEQDLKVMHQMNSSRTEMLHELLRPFLELFAKPTNTTIKERSLSHRELEIKRSLEKSSRPGAKERKKKSNEILIEEDRSANQLAADSLAGFLSVFASRMSRVRDTVDSWGNCKKYKYVQSPSIATFQQFCTDIQHFVTTLSELCFKEIDSELKRCEQLLSSLLESEGKVKNKNKELEQQLKVEKDKNKMIEHVALELQQKTLYSTIFLNQLSYGCDIDSHIREKLFQEAKKNGLVSSLSESQLFQSQLMKGHHRSGIQLGTDSRNLYDNNTNQFIQKELFQMEEK